MPAILVVDSDWYLRAQVRMYLSDAGYTSVELSESALLPSLMQVHLEPIVVIGRAEVIAGQIPMHLRNTVHLRCIVLRDAEDALPLAEGFDPALTLALPLDRPAFLHTLSLAMVRLHTAPAMALPIREPQHSFA